jgi:hypothetical protein
MDFVDNSLIPVTAKYTVLKSKWAFLQVNYELKDERGEEIENDALIAQLTLQF